MKRRKKQAEVVENVEAPKRKTANIATVSLIVYLLDKLSDIIYNALVNGFFGYIFTAYSSELSAYNNSYFLSYLKGGSKTRTVFKRVREFVSREFETSFILKKLRNAVCGLASVSVKTYGTLFLSFGIYTLLVYFIKALVPTAVFGSPDSDYLIVGICICLISTPLHFSRLTLARAVRTGRITSALFVDCFGYRDESFERRDTKNTGHSGGAILFGLIFGMLTFVIHPLQILAFLAISVVVALIIVTPEIGVLICIFALPFFSIAPNPTFLLAALLIVTSFSYLIKLVRGKRIIKIELLDMFVLLFLIMIYFSGMITLGGRASFYSAMISCILMFGYFLVVNLVRTEKWLHRCVLAIVSSGALVSLIGIIQYFTGNAPDQWLDKTYFTSIHGRVTSVFENPNYLAAYLAIVFPFAMYQAIKCKHFNERLLCVFSCLLIIVCTIFTWSRGAWLAIIVTALVFLMIYTRKTLRMLLAAVFAVPFLPFLLPQSIITRFTSIGDMSDSSTLYRVYTWKGSFEFLRDGKYFWSGIGYGTEAFVQIYPAYAYAGIESATHSHNLYLQILIGMGIGGLACFALVMLFYVQRCFEYIKEPSDTDSRLITAASLCAIFAILIMGLFDYVWYNYRVFFMFWVVLAIGVACIKIGAKEKSRGSISCNADENMASVDVEL